MRGIPPRVVRLVSGLRGVALTVARAARVLHPFPIDLVPTVLSEQAPEQGAKLRDYSGRVK